MVLEILLGLLVLGEGYVIWNLNKKTEMLETWVETFSEKITTIRDQLTIGEGTFIAAGALIIKDTTQWRGYLGSPAKEIKDSLELNP